MRGLRWTITAMAAAVTAVLVQNGGWTDMARREVQGGKDCVVLDSGKQSITFHLPGSALSLAGLVGKDGPQWIAEPAGPAPVWRLALQGPSGASKEIESAGVELTSVKTRSGRAEFVWDVAVEGTSSQVTMAVRTKPGDQLSYWSLEAKLPDGWKVSRADFPIIAGIRLEAAKKMAAPVGYGLEYDAEPDLSYEGTYPSCVAAMPFVAFYGTGNALYVGLHDTEGNHKVIAAKGASDGIRFTCTHWPAMASSGGTYKVPGEAAVGVIGGDYYNAAQIYRKFTFSAPWGKAGLVSARPIPQWLKDTELWLMPRTDTVPEMAEYKKAAEIFGVPIALHWYYWHQIPFDTLYPEYFPPKPDFAKGVKLLQDAGFRVMPYINGRLCDPNSKTWKEEGGDKWAARQESGEPYTEVYGSKVPLNVMCPYTTGWQKKIGGIVDRLINEYGVDGVYIDQIGAAAPVRCFNAGHGHPVGGGHMWVDGYRKMLDQIRKKLPKDRVLTTEEDGECWNDQLDALLLVNTPNWAKIIPLYQAVYSGRIPMFAFQYLRADDIERSLPFRAKMIRAFVWGSQLGWIEVGKLMASGAEKEAEFLRNMARCRRFGHKFLVTGRFAGLLDVTGDNPQIKQQTGDPASGGYMVDLPSVQASQWQAEDGSLGVVMANMSDAAHEVEVPLHSIAPKSRLEGKNAHVFGPDGPISTMKISGATLKITLPVRGAVILDVEK